MTRTENELKKVGLETGTFKTCGTSTDNLYIKKI